MMLAVSFLGAIMCAWIMFDNNSSKELQHPYTDCLFMINPKILSASDSLIFCL